MERKDQYQNICDDLREVAPHPEGLDIYAATTRVLFRLPEKCQRLAYIASDNGIGDSRAYLHGDAGVRSPTQPSIEEDPKIQRQDRNFRKCNAPEQDHGEGYLKFRVHHECAWFMYTVPKRMSAYASNIYHCYSGSVFENHFM